MVARTASDRLLPFSDAVVAIAMTLLILPLVEIGSSATTRVVLGDTPAFLEVLDESTAPLIGFTISFFVIARLWWAHHSLFQHVHAWTPNLVVANTVWLFTIVLLPWVTTFSTGFLGNRLVALLYVGTMTASSALLTFMARTIVRAEPVPDVAARRRYLGNLTTFIAFVVALVLCVTFPFTLYTPLLLLAFTPLVDRRIDRRLAASVVPRRDG